MAQGLVALPALPEGPGIGVVGDRVLGIRRHGTSERPESAIDVAALEQASPDAQLALARRRRGGLLRAGRGRRRRGAREDRGVRPVRCRAISGEKGGPAHEREHRSDDGDPREGSSRVRVLDDRLGAAGSFSKGNALERLTASDAELPLRLVARLTRRADSDLTRLHSRLIALFKPDLKSFLSYERLPPLPAWRGAATIGWPTACGRPATRSGAPSARCRRVSAAPASALGSDPVSATVPLRANHSRCDTGSRPPPGSPCPWSG